MLPVVDNAHVAEGQGLLTSHYAKQPVISRMLAALMAKAQDEEANLWTLINGLQLANHPMGGGPWSILDQIGELVGETRQGSSDADYVAALKIRIRVNRSKGLAEDIIQIAKLLVTTFNYYEWWPAAWELETVDAAAAPYLALVTYLGEAKSAGTAGNVRFSQSTNQMRWGSTTGVVANAAGFNDFVLGGFPNVMASLQKAG